MKSKLCFAHDVQLAAFDVLYEHRKFQNGSTELEAEGVAHDIDPGGDIY